MIASKNDFIEVRKKYEFTNYEIMIALKNDCIEVRKENTNLRITK